MKDIMDKLSSQNASTDKEQFEQAALHYHANPRPGKISVTPIKALANQRDLALAYSPGVAIPCLEIEKDPKKVSEELKLFWKDMANKINGYFPN